MSIKDSSSRVFVKTITKRQNCLNYSINFPPVAHMNGLRQYFNETEELHQTPPYMMTNRITKMGLQKFLPIITINTSKLNIIAEITRALNNSSTTDIVVLELVAAYGIGDDVGWILDNFKRPLDLFAVDFLIHRLSIDMLLYNEFGGLYVTETTTQPFVRVCVVLAVDPFTSQLSYRGVFENLPKISPNIVRMLDLCTNII